MKHTLNRGFSVLREKKRYFLLLPLAPGWIIPRILGTIAFVAHPTWTGFIAILSWWLIVPVLWWVGLKLWKRWRGTVNRAPDVPRRQDAPLRR